jgi:hypothetical protein
MDRTFELWFITDQEDKGTFQVKSPSTFLLQAGSMHDQICSFEKLVGSSYDSYANFHR